jgi:glycosyltransferase involved in cell wall biosynthesis
MNSKILSVVVPAYNEEESIGPCLERLVDQLDFIAEIIVVDNNSTDMTADIALSFAERFSEVTVMTEAEQGLVHARNAGLDAATGEAIARIDADTLTPPQWAQTVVEFLQNDTDRRWAALCGRGEAYGLPYGDAVGRLRDRFDPLRGRRRGRAGVKDVPVLYGSNMVLRRETWCQVRDRVSMRRDVFEDVDTGLCVREAGGRNAFLPDITVGVSPRRMESSIPAFVRYMSFLPRTLLLHKRYGFAAAAICVYLPGVTLVHAGRLLVIRAYDKETGTFGVKNVLRPVTDRVAP